MGDKNIQALWYEDDAALIDQISSPKTNTHSTRGKI